MFFQVKMRLGCDFSFLELIKPLIGTLEVHYASARMHVYITHFGDSLIPFINSYTSNHVPTKQLCMMQRHNLKIIETGNGKMFGCHCIRAATNNFYFCINYFILINISTNFTINLND